jgi:hypothetical protein
MLKKIICYLFGHSYFVVTRIDNDRSIFGNYICQRCNKDEAYQYDYGY